jgi:hypothetical protein
MRDLHSTRRRTLVLSSEKQNLSISVKRVFIQKCGDPDDSTAASIPDRSPMILLGWKGEEPEVQEIP